MRKRKPGSRNGSEAASGFYSTTTTTAGKAGVRRQTASRQKKSEKARVKKRSRQLAGRHGGRPLGGIVVARRDSQSRIKTQSHTRFPAPAPAAVSLALARAQPKRRPVTPGSSAAHAIKAGYCNACCVRPPPRILVLRLLSIGWIHRADGQPIAGTSNCGVEASWEKK